MANDRVQSELVVRVSDESEEDDYVPVTVNEPLPVSVSFDAPIARNFLPGTLTASTTAQQLVPVRRTRRRLVVKNTDAAITVYLGRRGVSASTGGRLTLLAGESTVVLSSADVWCIAASGTPVVESWDEFD